MLSNFDIDLLVKKLGIKNFQGCFYKDKLKEIKSNSSYILNLNSEFDENGNRNKGSHWVALCVDDDKQGIYFVTKGDNNYLKDSYKVRFEDIESITVGVIW